MWTKGRSTGITNILGTKKALLTVGFEDFLFCWIWGVVWQLYFDVIIIHVVVQKRKQVAGEQCIIDQRSV